MQENFVAINLSEKKKLNAKYRKTINVVKFCFCLISAIFGIVQTYQGFKSILFAVFLGLYFLSFELICGGNGHK